MELSGDSMTTQEVKRKLTAILSADVKGYSRLMGEDEEGTIRTLNCLQRNDGNPHPATPGSSGGCSRRQCSLAEFASVVDAVRVCCGDSERARNRNAELPENRRMEFRIGINLGDVMEEGEADLRGRCQYCSPHGESG